MALQLIVCFHSAMGVNSVAGGVVNLLLPMHSSDFIFTFISRNDVRCMECHAADPSGIKFAVLTPNIHVGNFFKCSWVEFHDFIGDFFVRHAFHEMLNGKLIEGFRVSS